MYSSQDEGLAAAARQLIDRLAKQSQIFPPAGDSVGQGAIVGNVDLQAREVLEQDNLAPPDLVEDVISRDCE